MKIRTKRDELSFLIVFAFPKAYKNNEEIKMSYDVYNKHHIRKQAVHFKKYFMNTDIELFRPIIKYEMAFYRQA